MDVKAILTDYLFFINDLKNIIQTVEHISFREYSNANALAAPSS